MSFRKMFIFFLVLFFSLSVKAQTSVPPLSKDEVPEILKDWIPFAMFGVDEKDFKNPCPYIYNNFESRVCSFPSKITIEVANSGFSFAQEWIAYDKGFLTLAGGYGLWPEDVMVNNQKTPVLIKDEKPVIFVEKAGEYTISGNVKWKKIPETINIPFETAAINLSVDGKKIEAIEVDTNGKIWLKRKQKVEIKTSDNASIKISRHIVDEIPIKIETIITLDISGQNREIFLANPELDGFKPISINSPLPLKLENDGKYKIYAKAGRWQTTIVSVSKGYFKEIGLKDKSKEGLATSEEIWTFEARPELRTVQIQGVQSIDPSLTDIPHYRRNFPAYLVRIGDNLVFDEKNRGFDESTPDMLSLNRKLVMSLNGDNYLVQDSISGEINKSSRLEMASGELGRVSINGIDQLITKLDKNQYAGVEVRSGYISLNADSRISGDIANIDVNGWNNDFNSVESTLVLPPGWSLFEAIGADNVYPTWIGSWSLLDVFIVLVASVATYRLMGLSYGILSLITLILVHHELPIASWLLLFASILISLEKILPEGFLLKITLFAKKIIFLILIFNVAVFSINHIKKAIYPSITGFSYGHYYGSDGFVNRPTKAKSVSGLGRGVSQEVMGLAESSLDFAADSVQAPREMRNNLKQDIKTYNLQNMIKDVNVQTGLGVSRWQGKQIKLSWNSSVESGHKLKLFFISARLNLVLSFARVLLLFLLMAILIIPRDKIKDAQKYATENFYRGASRISLILLVFLSVFLNATPTKATEKLFPSNEMLMELRARLLPEKDQTPDCFPNCVNIEKTAISVENDFLSIKNRVHVESEGKVIFPLPAILGNWRPDTVIINDKSFSPSSYKDNSTEVVLSKGINDVQIIGKLPQSEIVQINFPFRASIVEGEATGWSINGINEDKTVSGAIQLVRDKQINAIKAEEEFVSPQINPFLIVERNIDLGISFNVTTIVTNTNLNASGAVVKIPLLAGESVTTNGMDISENNVVLNIAKGVREIRWTSILEQKSLIELSARKNTLYTEVWKVTAGNIWNIKTQGLPKIQSSNSDSNTMVFKPWPEEKLQIEILRPEAIKGQIKTFDSVDLSLNPSERNLGVSLSMNLRSSLGTEHKIKLPKDAKAATIFIDGTKRFSRLEGEDMIFPVIPGNQNIKIEWSQPVAIKNLFSSPKIDVGASAVNINISTNMPRNRWILLAGGTPISPAILFWGVLPLIALLAFGLGLYPSSIPLKKHHWFLLFLGLSQTHMTAIAVIILWFVAFELRQKSYENHSKFRFNLRQIFLLLLTLVAFISLISGIGSGLLGTPEMNIRGYNSYSYNLGWYQDVINGNMPEIWVVSLPIYVWRGLMLIWALWLSFAVTNWAKWAFGCFSQGGIWKKEKL